MTREEIRFLIFQGKNPLLCMIAINDVSNISGQAHVLHDQRE